MQQMWWLGMLSKAGKDVCLTFQPLAECRPAACCSRNSEAALTAALNCYLCYSCTGAATFQQAASNGGALGCISTYLQHTQAAEGSRFRI